MTLDELLSQPLEPVTDNGFSARVIARVRAAEIRRVIEIGLLSGAAATAGCLLLPLQTFVTALNTVVLSLGTSTAVGAAAAALLLTLFADRQLFRS